MVVWVIDMIRVTIDLIPFGDEHKKEQIGQIEIGNIGRWSDDMHKYSYNGWYLLHGNKRNVVGDDILHCRAFPVLTLLSAVLSDMGMSAYKEKNYYDD